MVVFAASVRAFVTLVVMVTSMWGHQAVIGAASRVVSLAPAAVAQASKRALAVRACSTVVLARISRTPSLLPCGAQLTGWIITGEHRFET